MIEDRQNMTIEELVDILGQKTEKFTQLLAHKDFGNGYIECKQAIKQILAEIETQKETTLVKQNKTTSAWSTFLPRIRLSIQFHNADHAAGHCRSHSIVPG